MRGTEMKNENENGIKVGDKIYRALRLVNGSLELVGGNKFEKDTKKQTYVLKVYRTFGSVLTDAEFVTHDQSTRGLVCFCQNSILVNWISFKVERVGGKGNCAFVVPEFGDIEEYLLEQRAGYKVRLAEDKERKKLEGIRQVMGDQFALFEKGLVQGNNPVWRCEYGRRDHGKFILIEAPNDWTASRKGSEVAHKMILKTVLAEETDLNKSIFTA
jgi:hypothetical protein